MERVVISGVGVASPIGCSHGGFLRRLFAGVSGIGPIRRFDAGRFRSSLAAELHRDDLDTSGGPLDHEIRRMDRFVHLAIHAARQAIEESGRPGEASRGGVFLGLGMGGLPHMESGVVRQETRGPRKTGPYLIPSLIPSMAAGLVSLDLGIEGCQYTFASACSSGSQALGEAAAAIRTGRVEWAVAGGTEAVITPITYSGFEAMRALALTADPARAPLPLDHRRAGMVVGEGAAVFVLESASRAAARGARARAALLGYATVSGGDGLVMRCAGAAERAMRSALDDARLEPAEVDVLFSQGMGLPSDDRELDAVLAVFGRSGPVTTSIEGHLGHTFGASGPLCVAAALGALERQEVPPTLGFERPSVGYEALDITGESRPRRIRHCLVNTYGFGGLNASLICSSP